MISGFLAKVVSHIFKETALGYRRDIIKLLNCDSSAVLLDCGCGDGSFTLEVAKKIEARQIYGLDIKPKILASAAVKGIKTLRCDLNQGFKFKDGVFDVVVANQVIEHLYNTDSFLKEVYRVLKRGGYAIVSTPNLASYHNILYLLAGWQPYWVNVSDVVYVNTWHPTDPSRFIGGSPAHMRAFTVGALVGLLEYYGFTIEKVVGSGVYPLPVALAGVISKMDGRHAAIVTVKARK